MTQAKKLLPLNKYLSVSHDGNLQHGGIGFDRTVGGPAARGNRSWTAGTRSWLALATTNQKRQNNRNHQKSSIRKHGILSVMSSYPSIALNCPNR